MPFTENHFLTADNTNIVHRNWSVESAKANLIIIHGMGEHGMRYQHVVDYFNQHQFNVFSWDARGHGLSGGQLGHIPNGWQDFRSDMNQYLNLITDQFNGLPTYILGHSLGGLKTLDYALHYPAQLGISGLIISSPAIGEVGASAFLMMAAKLLDKIMPSLSMSSGLDVSQLSRDAAWNRQSVEDPLYHDKASPRIAVQVPKVASWVQEQAHQLNYPTLLIHGTDDSICSIEGSRQFNQSCQQVESTKNLLEFREYPGGYHELLNDINKNEVLSDVFAWLQNKI